MASVLDLLIIQGETLSRTFAVNTEDLPAGLDGMEVQVTLYDLHGVEKLSLSSATGGVDVAVSSSEITVVATAEDAAELPKVGHLTVCAVVADPMQTKIRLAVGRFTMTDNKVTA